LKIIAMAISTFHQSLLLFNSLYFNSVCNSSSTTTTTSNNNKLKLFSNKTTDNNNNTNSISKDNNDEEEEEEHEHNKLDSNVSRYIFIVCKTNQL
jgi:hypothetical protein